MGEKITLRELAKKIGVSASTISIVLNGKPGVGDDTREKVLSAVRDYGYIHQKRAAGNQGNVLLIKYVISGALIEENQGFISAIIDAIEGQLGSVGLGMTMTLVKSDLLKALREIDYKQYKGIIFIASEIERALYPLLKSIPIPFVVVDNTMPDFHYSSVCMNNYENVRMALEYCRELGHKEIGHLKSSVVSENFQARNKAFNMYTEELELDTSEEYEFSLRATMLGAYEDMLEHIGKGRTFPGCFFADNDTIALGAIKALQECGYSIPEDISVIGFDDIPYSSISSPALTTIRVQRDIIGRQAVNQLLLQADSPEFSYMKTRITGYLVERESVAAPGKQTL